MKYLKDLFKIIVFVAIMYLPLSWISFQDSLATIDRLAEEETLSKLTSVQKMTQALLEKNEILEACQRLDAEVLAKNIATYTVIGPESSCYKPEGMSELPPISENNKAISFNIKNIPLTFIKFQTQQYQWAISVLTPQKINIYERLRTNLPLRKALISDFLIVIYTVFSFILCAVLIFAESIQNRYRSRGEDPTWLKVLNKIFGFLQLNDMKIIKSATAALVKQNENLNKDIDLLQTSLEFSILNEIKKNNHQIPYTFFGTVAKVDINGFSKVVAAGEALTTQLMTTNLENFGCELLQRYEGLFEKSIGDEIVVVFKGNDSQLKATAFSRDLMFEFSQVAFELNHEKRKFTLKSAIYSSDITFNKRVAGYGFLGNALTLTTRLMDAVTQKNKNILSITEDQFQDISLLVVKPSQTENFQFKNMADQKGYQIDQFKKITDMDDTHLFKYFRSDSHIIYLLELLYNKTTLIAPDAILDALLKIQIRQTHAETITAWLRNLKSIENMYPSQIAKTIMLGKNLIPQHQWTPEMTQTLLQIPRDIEGRINASVIDVLMEKNIHALEDENPQSFIIPGDPSARTRANLLMFQAIKEMEDQIFIEILEMIKSSQSQVSKSGIYAACQIIEYYKIKNPAKLETYPHFKEVSELLLQIRSSTKIKLSERLQERLQSL